MRLTSKGKDIYTQLEAKQKPWATSLADDFENNELKNVSTLLKDLITKIESK
ncbi:MAG: hypothetical protein HOM14_16030 [Gammaproteobacteria bacterium]|nr:hypothetical protein [Gammaproteobacteria bacterium]MBT3725273.1 hypothetical protein [Gammaproteobacteria bacterium]MBT4076766.1 hypothetical protein [Gammaproteobacteria bacterium]MBT4195319.1 hypothetical protein [Gammaproteobacteria bacterium]MBT4449622.1 hypothetical protein [Gammaproteobacteria bacterium]